MGLENPMHLVLTVAEIFLFVAFGVMMVTGVKNLRKGRLSPKRFWIRGAALLLIFHASLLSILKVFFVLQEGEIAVVFASMGVLELLAFFFLIRGGARGIAFATAANIVPLFFGIMMLESDKQYFGIIYLLPLLPIFPCLALAWRKRGK